MEIPVVPKSNSRSGVAPVPSSLETGELALNTGDGKLYAKLANGAVRQVKAIDDRVIAGVTSVNGQTGDVRIETASGGVTSVNGQTGDVTVASGVTSVNGQTGDVTVASGVTSVNGQTGDVTIEVGGGGGSGVTSFNGLTGAITYTPPVTSVNGLTGAVNIDTGVTRITDAVAGSLQGEVSFNGLLAPYIQDKPSLASGTWTPLPLYLGSLQNISTGGFSYQSYGAWQWLGSTNGLDLVSLQGRITITGLPASPGSDDILVGGLPYTADPTDSLAVTRMYPATLYLNSLLNNTDLEDGTPANSKNYVPHAGFLRGNDSLIRILVRDPASASGFSVRLNTGMLAVNSLISFSLIYQRNQ